MSDHAGVPVAEPVRRTFEIEDPTNRYFIHVLSAWLVPIFAKLGIKPNSVSLTGMAFGILAGVAYSFYHTTWCACLGFGLMLGWHVMDGADGQLARLTKSYSEFGKILDGICDYVTFTAVYIGLALAMSRYDGGWVWWVVACAGVAHAVQAAIYEMQRQDYNSIGLGRASAALPDLSVKPKGFAAGLHTLYARVQIWGAGGAVAFQRDFAALLAAQPTRVEALRLAYRQDFAPTVRRWGILGSNYRTLGLFLAALVKLPILYFFFEIFGFTAILLLFLASQKQHYRTFLAQVKVQNPG